MRGIKARKLRKQAEREHPEVEGRRKYYRRLKKKK